MTAPTHRSILERAADWTARHPVAGPIGWGLLSGVTYSGCVVGGLLAGYIVGRSGVGRGLSIFAFAALPLLFMILFLGSMMQGARTSACPSCDAVGTLAALAIPFYIAIFLVPFLIGIWLGGRARNRAATTV